MKILYIEDNEDNILILKRRLGGVPELILMDLSRPLFDVWLATRRLKASPQTKAIPIIALTSHAMVGEEEKALGAGCDDFDTKPIELQRLLGKIRALVPGEDAP